MPTLTILMPAYNAALFIKEAIDSLLNQTFTDFELWIVNDASTDNTLQLISTYTDPRIQIVNNHVNVGRDRIVNTFITKIKVPFFTITDADDVSHPLRFQKQIEKLQFDKALMMCGTSYTAIDTKGFRLHTTILMDDHTAIIENIHKHSQFLGGTVVFRSEVTKIFKPFYREVIFDAFADADLCCRVAERYPSTNLKDALYYYRIVEDSMSRKTITAQRLNMYKLIYYLHTQRISIGKDMLENNEVEIAMKYLDDLTSLYSPSSLQRHIGFYHLYWGLPALAVKSALKSIRSDSSTFKNFFSFLYIIFRSGLFYLNRVINKTHYTALISRTT
jgi:glycosyltransferase involved in cell wall biosynthesis